MTTVAPATNNASLKTAVRWTAVRRELLHIVWITMELALITPITLSLLPWGRLWSPFPFFLLLAAVMLLAFLLIRFMNALTLNKPTQQNVIVIALLLTQLLLMRGLIYAPRPLFDLSWLADFFNSLAEPGNQQWFFDISLFVTIAFVWWRGIRLVGRTPDVFKAGLYLRVGGLIIAPAAIWFGRQLLWNVTPFLLLFFAAGLLTIALVRAEQLEISKSGQSAAVTPRWLLTIGLVTLGIVLTAVSTAAFLSSDTTLLIVQFFTPLWLTVNLALKILSSALLYVSAPLLFIFEQFLLILTSAIGWVLVRVIPLVNETLAQLGLGTEEQPFEFTEQEEVIQQTLDDKIVIILLMLAVVLLVALAVRRATQQRAQSEAQVRRGAAPLLASSQNTLIDKLRDRLSELLNWRTAASIRRTYRRMCQTAAELGFPRGQAETPIEFLTTLRQAWPEHQKETAVITNAYIKIRYGEYPESSDELEEIRLSWQRLQQATTSKNRHQETAVRLQNELEK